MPTALEQQEQLNRILASSVAPVLSYNQGNVDIARLAALDRVRTQRDREEDALKLTLANLAADTALQRTKLENEGRLTAVRAQVQGYLDKLDEKERNDQLKTLQAIIPREPGESDTDFFARATQSLPDILAQHDTHIGALQDQSVKLSQATEIAKENFAKAAAARAIVPLLDEKSQQAIQPLLGSGRSIDVALAAVPTRSSFNPISSGLTEKQKNAIRATYDDAFTKASEKPQVPDSLTTRFRNTELELARAIQARDAFTKAVPFSLLGQQAKPSTNGLVPPDELRKMMGQSVAPVTTAPSVSPTVQPVRAGGAASVPSTSPAPSLNPITIAAPFVRDAAASFGANVLAPLIYGTPTPTPPTPIPISPFSRFSPFAAQSASSALLPAPIVPQDAGSPDEEYLQQILAPSD